MRIGTRAVVEFKQGANRKLVIGGFQVMLSITDCGDGMFQQIKHPAVFKTEAQAERFLNRIDKAHYEINLNNWIIGNHPCDAWQRAPEDNPLQYCPLPISF